MNLQEFIRTILNSVLCIPICTGHKKILVVYTHHNATNPHLKINLNTRRGASGHWKIATSYLTNLMWIIILERNNNSFIIHVGIIKKIFPSRLHNNKRYIIGFQYLLTWNTNLNLNWKNFILPYSGQFRNPVLII
jgi:hypothetical protein